ESARKNLELIKRLRAAREMDESEANHPGLSAVHWEDYMVQIGKVDKALKELFDGFEVSQVEVDDALWVPPRSLSPTAKSALIHRLQVAMRQDEYNEDELTFGAKFSDIPYPINSMLILEDHKNLAESVLKDIDIGEDVHWQTIERALQPPDLDC